MKNKNFVFDTNCLISSLLVPSSVARLAYKKADENGTLLFSIETLAELNEVIGRSKFDKYIDIAERLDFVKRFENRAKIINTSSAFIDCRDVKDNKFLNLAYDGNADCMVTGDADLLILHPFHHIPIISPAEFLNDFVT